MVLRIKNLLKPNNMDKELYQEFFLRSACCGAPVNECVETDYDDKEIRPIYFCSCCDNECNLADK